MRHGRIVTEIVFVALLALAVILLPGCNRAEEESVPAEPLDDGGEALVSLDLPQTSPELGLTLNDIPRGLIVTYNEGLAMEVTDTSQPDLRFTLNVERPDLPERSPATVGDFEVFIGGHNEGVVNDRGTLKTALGKADWALGVYHEEDQTFEDLRVFVPHPSGNGILVISAVGPENTASVDQRLDVVKALLEEIT